jgi:hypothetical protein
MIRKAAFSHILGMAAAAGLAGCATPDTTSPGHVSGLVGQTREILSVTYGGTATFGSAPAGDLAGIDGTLEYRAEPEIDQQLTHSGINASRVPADHVPTPWGLPISADNTGFAGFNGLSHRDQRLANAGKQFSLEPPDQALCVGNGFVLEGVNTALRVFDTSGNALTAPVAINPFFGLSAEIIRGPVPVFGDFTSDPKCYYDSDLRRWFVTILQLGVDSASGNFTGKSSVQIAVSSGDNPATSTWSVAIIDTTNDGSNGVNNPGCPCFGDQPLIGADANGFYVTTNEFPLFTAGFNGAQIYAMSKSQLASGKLGQVVHIGGIPLAEGPAYTVQPATVPPGGTYESANGGTQYFLSALDFNATLDNRIAVWALSNTSALSGTNPGAVTLQNVLVTTQVYGQPPDSQQRPGFLPLANSVQPAEKLELLAGNDDRMNQTVFAGGQLWSAVNTVVKTPNGPTRVGVAYFVVSPSMSSNGVLSASLVQGGYVAVNQNDAMYPAIGVNAAGKAVLGFTLVGPDFFPSTAWVRLYANGPGFVHIAGAGAGPDDGFTGYKLGGAPNRTGRWGDYGAAVADEAGNIWLANEYIPDARRTVLANWGTFVSKVAP